MSADASPCDRLPRSVLAIYALPSVSTGTAFFVSWEGHLVTNHHVVSGATTVRVKLDER